MARDEQMALCPWGALGGGKFTTEQKRRDQDTGRDPDFAKPSDKDVAVSKALEAVATKKNTAITSIAIAYIRAKYPYVYPIVGGRRIEHLKGNIEALGIELSREEVDEIDGAAEFDIGFPMNFLFEFGGGKYRSTNTSADVGLLKFSANLEGPRVLDGPKPHGLEGFGNNK
jgi:diketogulonate reductase-like aldo/keto reductase